MYFVLQTPSLQHLAMVKVVSHLWNRRDILTPSAQSFHPQPTLNPYEDRQQWKTFERKVKMKIWALPLPEKCKNLLLNLIKPLGDQIFNWCRYHYLANNDSGMNDVRYLRNLVPQQLCWTMHGTVEYTQTARLILKDEAVDLAQRYELACLNCLEDEARHLIKFFPEHRRQNYMNEVAHRDNVSWRYGPPSLSVSTTRILIMYFTCALSGNMDHLSNKIFQSRLLQGESIHKCFFEVMVLNGNRASCEYFFNKFNQREKDQALVEFQTRVLSYDWGFRNCNFMYYISLMNEEQKERMFRERIGEVLKCLLRWPTQSLFVEAAECGWNNMNEDHCALVLHAILELNLCDGYKDYDYPRLFWEGWRLSSHDYKQLFLENTQYAEHALLEKYEEFLKLILNEAPLRDLEVFFDVLSEVLLFEGVISGSTLRKCKEKAKLVSSNDPENEEKRLRSQYLNRLVDLVMKTRINKRRMKKV